MNGSQIFTAFVPSSGLKTPEWRSAQVIVGYGVRHDNARLQFLIHGMGDDPMNFCNYMGPHDSNEIVVCPEGLPFWSLGPKVFNAGECCTTSDVDDIDFLNKLLEIIEYFFRDGKMSAFSAGDRAIVEGDSHTARPPSKSPKNLQTEDFYTNALNSYKNSKLPFTSVHTGGFSNGAMLSELWGCTRPDVLDSIFSGSGATGMKPGGKKGLRKCEEAYIETINKIKRKEVWNRRALVKDPYGIRGINYFHVHGENDWKVPTSGRSLVTKFPSLWDTMQSWTVRNVDLAGVNACTTQDAKNEEGTLFVKTKIGPHFSGLRYGCLHKPDGLNSTEITGVGSRTELFLRSGSGSDHTFFKDDGEFSERIVRRNAIYLTEIEDFITPLDTWKRMEYNTYTQYEDEFNAQAEEQIRI